ncbi:MAG: iron ABC transporter permease, partial [Marinobacter sp.]|nr:iron ABC transporter permease [Marinobacter sp.]MDX5472785.1 iron ABC transporter permease [Marinobacter sp.]
MIRDHSGRLPLAPALFLLGALLAVAALASIGSGAYDLALMDILKVVAGREASDPVAAMVVLEVRLPRFLLGFLVGAV